MNLRISKSLAAVAVSGLLAAPLAHATNGYFMHGYGSKEKGMAGAGVAYTHNDALAAATNPAAMAFVDKRVDIGLQIFAPSPRGYTVTGNPPAPAGTTLDFFCQTGPGNPIDASSVPCQPPFSVNPGTVESENDMFLIPHFGYNHPLNDKTTVGIAIYGNGGMNTEYATGSARTLSPATGALADFPGTFGFGTAGVNLEQMFFNFNSSYKLNPRHALGGSLILVGSRFRAQGLEQFSGFSTDPTNLSGNVNSLAWGFGAKVGYQGEVAKGVRVGVSYQSKISMGEFDEYKGLFAESGDFDIPSTYTLGASFDVGKSAVIVADYQRINYTDVTSLSNPVSKLTGGGCLDSLNGAILRDNTFPPTGPLPLATGSTCLGGPDGAGFGWEDIGIIKLGFQFTAANIDWRVGYSHSDQPIPESETLFNILAPAVIQDHVTGGLTWPIGKSQELNLALMYALEETVKGPNPFDGGATTVEIEMSQWDLQAGWAWKF
ncbi:MAG: outer membrane protein transport protein [Thiotrichales bacterium]|nr:MAG: outer membrane protein transport protein [Thiotrichales bacterium]